MFRETQNYTNEELNILKKHYNDKEAWWNRPLGTYFFEDEDGSAEPLHLLVTLKCWKISLHSQPNVLASDAEIIWFQQDVATAHTV